LLFIESYLKIIIMFAFNISFFLSRSFFEIKLMPKQKKFREKNTLKFFFLLFFQSCKKFSYLFSERK
jgi:hypothetical protein